MAAKHRLAQVISFGAGVVVVGLLAIAIGYFMGNYAVRMVTGPKLAPSQGAARSQETALPQDSGAPRQQPVADTSGGGGSDNGAPRTDAEPPTPREPLAVQLNDDQYQPSKEVSTQADLSSQLFKVQVGEFPDREEARRFAVQLKGDGYNVYVTSLKPYRVQVGAFELRERADRLATEVRGRGYEPVTVVR